MAAPGKPAGTAGTAATPPGTPEGTAAGAPAATPAGTAARTAATPAGTHEGTPEGTPGLAGTPATPAGTAATPEGTVVTAATPAGTAVTPQGTPSPAGTAATPEGTAATPAATPEGTAVTPAVTVVTAAPPRVTVVTPTGTAATPEGTVATPVGTPAGTPGLAGTAATPPGTAGTAAPPRVTAVTPTGTAATPVGTPAGTPGLAGTAATPPVTAATPEGTPEGTAVTPAGAAVTPEGTAVTPPRTPVGTAVTPAGTAAPPRVAAVTPEGTAVTEATPEGTVGTEATPEGRAVTAATPEGTEATPAVTPVTPAAPPAVTAVTVVTPEGTAVTPEGTAVTGVTAAPPAPFRPPLRCGGDAPAESSEPVPVLRQILAACAFPDLLDSPALPEAARDRARSILRGLESGNIGGYNHEHRSHAVPATVSRFLEFRDGGVPCDPNDVILCSGTATVIPFVLSLLSLPPPALPPGLLLPVPGPALLPLLAALAGAVAVPVALPGPRGWAPDPAELRRALRGARGRCRPLALWLSNPGDPTGHVLSRAEARPLLALAAEAPLLILADEVHQELCWNPSRPFVSLRRVLAELGPPLASRVQILTLHSLATGAGREGGFRAGFLELRNVPESLRRPFELAQSIPRPCVLGRILLELLLRPPDPADPVSRDVEKHRQQQRRALAANARLLQRVLGGAPGIRCPPPAGGPRAFPSVRIPARARGQARALGLEPDRFFCRRLEEATGVAATPGSHFGMDGDRGHLALSLLLPPPVLERALLLLRHFHAQFLREFS